MSQKTKEKRKTSDLSLKEIESVLKEQKKTHFYKRILFLKYKKQQKTHEEITSLLHVCLKTLTNWMQSFSRGGITELLNVSYDRREPKLKKVEKEIREKIQKGEVKSIALCRKYLKDELSISASISNIHWFFKKNEIVLQENKTYSRGNAE